MANEYIRKEWAGGAARTTLSGTITAGATSISVVDASSFPAGTFPFVLVIDRGTANEEKILCSTRGATSFTVLQRGYDGSVAASHAAGAYIEHVLDAYTIDQANAIAAVMTTAGDLLYKSVTGDNTSFARLPIGTADRVLLSTGTAPQWGQVGANGIAAGAVGNTQLASNAVTNVKILDATIALAKLVSGTAGHILVVNGSGVPAYVALSGDATISALGALTIGANAINAGKLAADAVTTTKILNANVTLDKLAAGSVDDSKLASPLHSVRHCTSGTRPGSPSTGDIIVETDKDRVRFWNGTSWQLISGLMGATYAGTGTVISSSANANLSHDTESLDTDSFGSVGSATVTAPEAGVYLITIDLTATAGSPLNGLGTYITITANGRDYEYAWQEAAASSHTLMVPMNAGSTAVVNVQNLSGGSITVSHYLGIRRVAD